MKTQFFVVFILTILAKQHATFQSGFNYIYKYESEIELKSANISLKYNSKLDVHIQKNDHKVVLKVANIDQNFGLDDQFAKNLLEFPISFEQENGHVKNVLFVDENDSQASIWNKKSILNLLDFGIDQGKKNVFYGECDTSTEILVNNSEFIHLVKYKSNCHNNLRIKGQYLRDQKILNTKIDRNIRTEIKVTNNVLNSSFSEENVKTFNEFNPKSSNSIQIKNSLILSSIEKTSSLINTDNLKTKLDSDNLVYETMNFNTKISGLLYDPDQKTKIEKHYQKEFKKVIKDLKLGTLEASETFLATIRHIRKYLKSNTKLLDKMFRDSSKKDKIFKFLLEAYTSSGIDVALSSISKALDIENLQTDDKLLSEKESKQIEEFLFSSSLMSQHSHRANQLIKIISSNWNKLTLFDIKEKAILALGSHSDQEFLDHIKSQILVCKNELCIVTLLESIKNSKSNLIEEFIFENIKSSCPNQPMVCLISLKTLSYLNIADKMDMFYHLFEIFSSNLIDKEIRIEALNVLVDKYSSQIEDNDAVFQNLIYTIQIEIKKNLKTNEFLIFIQKLILNKLNLREKFLNYLNNSSLINLFDFFVQNGFSNTMSSSIKSYPSGNLTYNLNQLMNAEGYLKNFDFSVSFKEVDGTRLDFLKVELYADNLSSFSTKLKQKNKDKKDPISFLHLSIMGQKLKIAQLFKGYAGMISLLWSLPTTPTSLFNSNFLLNDQNEYMFLSNGMSVRIENLGTLGIDIQGVTDVSLWSQYAKIKLKTQASFINEQNLYLINNFNILNTVQTKLKTQFLVDFDMNTNFAHDPYKLCIKMSQNKFNIWESNKVLNGEANKLQEINNKIPIEGSGFMFSRETVKFC